jgi:hypothetical protein
MDKKGCWLRFHFVSFVTLNEVKGAMSADGPSLRSG